MPIIMIIATVFVGWYFYSSASNIGKNGVLWVGIAFGTFLVTSIFASLIFHYFSDYNLNSQVIVSIAGFFGIVSLGFVNHYVHIIHD